MSTPKTFQFNRLNKKAKLRACKDYQKGWLETHPDDPIDFEDTYSVLVHDLKEERYTKFGRLLY